MNLGGKVICCGSERLFLCASNPVKMYDSNIFVLRALFQYVYLPCLSSGCAGPHPLDGMCGGGVVVVVL